MFSMIDEFLRFCRGYLLHSRVWMFVVRAKKLNELTQTLNDVDTRAG